MEEETPTTEPVLPVVRARARTPRVGGLRRPRLHDLVDRRADHVLTLLVAPAGSGKTTLLGHLVERIAPAVAWYQASADDHDPASFLRQLAHSFEHLLPPDGSHPWTTVADAISALDDSVTVPTTLVVDDGHLLNGSPAEAVLEQFVTQAPAALSIVVAGRQAPTFDVSRLRVSGGLLDIGPTELAFRSWEVERLFRDFYNHALTSLDLVELMELNQGWAAGLQLFHLASRTKAPAERRRLLRTFPSSSLVRDYLMANVFAALPESLREALVHTSVLGVLSIDRCSLLAAELDSPDAVQWGADLSVASVETGVVAGFSEWCDDGGFRHQPLWRSFLRDLLAREVGTAVLSSYYLAAGRVHEAIGDVVEALEAFARSGSTADLDSFVARRGPELAESAGRWVQDLPGALVASSPWLELAAARWHLGSGRVAAAVRAYETAAASFDLLAVDGGEDRPADVDRHVRARRAGRRSRIEALSLRAWTDVLTSAGDESPLPDLGRASTTYDLDCDEDDRAGDGDGDERADAATLLIHRQAAEVLRAALAGEPPADDRSSVVRRLGARPPALELADALAGMLAGRFDDCQAALAEVYESPDASPVVLAAARLTRALVDFLVGEPGAAAEARDAADAAERVGVPWLGVAGRVVLLATGQAGSPTDAVRWARSCDAAGDGLGSLGLLLAGGLGALGAGLGDQTARHDSPGATAVVAQPAGPVRRDLVDWRADAAGASALLEEVVDRCRAMDLSLVEGWALVGLAVAHVRGSQPEAVEVVGLAEKTARSLGVPALQAAAYAVASVAGDRSPAESTDLRAQATLLAASSSERGPMILGRLARALHPRLDEAAVADDSPHRFVGRRRELAELLTRWEAAAGAGGAQCVRVEGESGIGKTALITELARHVELAGGQVRWCRGIDRAPRYWPWRHLVRSLVEEASPTELAAALGGVGSQVLALVPELMGDGSAHVGLGSEERIRVAEFDLPDAGPVRTPSRIARNPDADLGPSAADDETVRLAEGIERLLAWATRRRPMLLVFDDAQRTDLESLRVLRSLLLALRATPVLIVVGCRDEEWSPEVLAMVGERALSTAVRLEGMAGDDLRELVRIGVARPVTDQLVEHVGDLTGGNPAFVDDVIRELRAKDARRGEAMNGAGAGHGGHRSASTPGAETSGAAADELIPIPHGLRDLTARRLDSLPALAVAAIQTGAMLEPRVDMELLARCLELPADRLRIELEAATRARLLVPLGPGVWGFPSDGVRRLLAEGVPDEAAAQVHLRAADCLEERAVASMVVSATRLAQHLLVAAAAGLLPAERLVRWIAEAAAEAAAVGRFEDSIDLCQRALEVVGLGPAARGEVLYHLAVARRFTEGERAARTAFVTAANAGRATRNASLLARAALGYGRTISEPTVVDALLVSLLEEAQLVLPPGDSAVRAEVEARLAAVPRAGLDGLEAQAVLSTAACDRAYRVSDPRAVAAALDTWHGTLWGPDLLPARLDAAAEMARYAEDASDPELLFRARRHRHHDLLEQGDVAAADVELAAAARIVRELPLPSSRWRLGVMRAGRALLDGRFGEAERLAADALSAARGDDSPVPHEYYAVQMLLRSRELGRLQAFDSSLRRLDERRPEMAVWRAARAYVLSETGRPAEARTELHRFLAEDLVRVTHDVHWLPTMALLGEVAATLRQDFAVEHLYRVLRPWSGLVVVCGAGAAVWGSVARVLGQLAGALERYDEAVVYFDDALSRETRLGSGPLLARTKLAYGAMLVSASAGDRDGERERQGRALVADAVETAEGYGMVGVAREGSGLLAAAEVGRASRPGRPHVADVSGIEVGADAQGAIGTTSGRTDALDETLDGTSELLVSAGDAALDRPHIVRAGSAVSSELSPVDAGLGPSARGGGDRDANGGSRRRSSRGRSSSEPLPGPSGSSPTTALRCLGSFRFEVRGRLIDLGAMKPRVRSVLWLLSVNAGHAVHAETLIDALWPDAAPSAGRRNLQVAISSLRQALEPGTKRGLWVLLAREGDSYRLVMGDDVECDLRSFAQLIGEARNHRAAKREERAVAAFERALAAYTGDLIPEAGPADWIVGPRDALRQQAAGTALALAEMRLEQEEPAAAIAACERGLSIDRYRDELWRALFVACERDGNHVVAARARRQYDAVLAELGISSS